jgi:hypothetical protein
MKNILWSFDEKESNLPHLQSYECRAYLLKNIIFKKNRLKSRVFIDYLVKYDFTNVFRIWIFSCMQIIWIKDIIFDKTLFYDFAKLNSRHLLIINVKETLEILKVSNNIFFEVIIEDENDLSINHLKNKLIESWFEESVDQTNSIEKTSFFHVDIKNIYLFTFKMISKRDQEFNENITDMIFFLQIDL